MARRENWIWIILLVYAAGFMLFPPRVLLINDEERYVTQAVAFSHGALTVPGANMLDPRGEALVASDYPPGTSLLQAPFVLVGGWRAAAALSVVSLVVLTVFTRLLLREYALQPAFAVLVPAFFGALFFGRVAMSDVPAAALVAVALWLMKRAERSGWRGVFGAGIASGLCLLFREPVVILLAPFAAGLMLSRPRAAPALLLGGALGLATRLILAFALFGNALYVRDSGFGFSLRSGMDNMPQYALVLLLMFPLGAILPFVYRGPQRARVVSAFALYALLFLFYDYNAWRDNGPLKGTILTSRFIIAALPLLVLMAADVYPRLHSRLSSTLQRVVDRAIPVGYAALAVLAFAIHPLVRRLDQEPFSIVQAIQLTTASDIPVVINEKAAGKYLSPVYGERRLIGRSAANTAQLAAICREFGGLQLLLLDRSDTEMFRRDAAENARFLSDIEHHLWVRSVYDRAHGTVFRLRIFDVSGCSPGGEA